MIGVKAKASIIRLYKSTSATYCRFQWRTKIYSNIRFFKHIFIILIIYKKSQFWLKLERKLNARKHHICSSKTLLIHQNAFSYIFHCTVSLFNANLKRQKEKHIPLYISEAIKVNSKYRLIEYIFLQMSPKKYTKKKTSKYLKCVHVKNMMQYVGDFLLLVSRYTMHYLGC